MYCLKCGNEITGQVKFCPKCGEPVKNGTESRANAAGQEAAAARPAPVMPAYEYDPAYGSSQAVPSFIAQAQRELEFRNENQRALSFAHDYFSEKADQYEKVEQLYDYSERCDHTNAFPLVAAIISSVPLILTFVFCLKGSVEWQLPFFIFLFTAGMFTLYFWKLSSHAKAKERTVLEIQKTEDKLLRYYREYEARYGACCVPYEYSDPEIIATLMNYISTGQALTVQDAIAKFTNDSVNLALLEYAQATLEYARQAELNTRYYT